MKRKILVPMFASAVALSINTVSNADEVETINDKTENNDAKAIALDEYKEEQYKKATVKDGVAVKIRENGDVKKVAYSGESFKVVATQGEWTKVYVDEENQGWVPSRYIDIEQTQGYITAEKVNFRTENNIDSEIIEELEIGKDLQVLEVQDEWIKVKSGEQEGFVNANYISEEAPVIEEEEEVLEEENTTIEENNTDEVLVASYEESQRPSTQTNTSSNSSESSNNYTQETEEVEEETSNESQESENTSSSQESEEAQDVPASSSSAVQAVLNLAYSKQGSPYVWGAEGPNSFDCSGFTSYVFKNAVGVNLPRTSSAQSNFGTTVSRSNLQPGDLVFFNTSGSGVSHVGIYIGNGNMIHSPSSGKSVHITSINSSYYSSRFVNAKRVL